MPEMTITEALAELKVVDKRITKKREFIASNAMRPEQVRDALEKEGGSVEAIRRELQAIADLEENKVAIRRAIQQANETTNVTVGKQTRSIADWLVWRRDVAPQRQSFLTQLRGGIERHRQDMLKQGRQVTTADSAKPNDVVVHLDEVRMAQDAEELEAALETLDGQLSLKNATVTVAW